MIEKPEGEPSQEIEKTIEQEVRGANWEANKIGFGQHMRDEDSVRGLAERGNRKGSNAMRDMRR